jgi:hypothetical protein
MPFDHGELTDLITQIAVEGDPRILMAPIDEASLRSAIPEQWRVLLTERQSHLRTADLLWRPAESILPRLIGVLRETLQGVGLITTNRRNASLLYVFTKEGELFARRGFPPIDKLPSVSGVLPVNLLDFYQIHNGWVDLFSGDTGLLPLDEWQIVGRENGDGQGFLEIFTTGGNGMGFDLGETPPTPYIIWSDEDIERVEDFWSRVDSWLATGLQSMDTNYSV